ncbi:unnamed protein product [Caenorhabditis angaria]|uniref:Glycosyltransferase family 92 protein n=1 Tax=Caenorhabditis angaria TaxID=860376 RepID=A0A9P1N948_9PELO|nr:unnamed protein product [Caenorhabditis angaria]
MKVGSIFKYFLCIIVICLVISLIYKVPALLKNEDLNVFVHSAYYFKKSHSLGNNAIAILMTMERSAAEKIENSGMSIVEIDDQMYDQTNIINFDIEPLHLTKSDLVTVLAKSNIHSKPIQTELRINDGTIQIPIKKLRKEVFSPVVFCFSPLIMLNQWQKLMLQVLISNKYQGHVHLYISRLTKIYIDVIKYYSKNKLLSYEIWPDTSFAPEDEPLFHFEMRTKKATNTDCLLQFKNIAQFISFPDLEDLLIPNSGLTYSEEFSKYFESSTNLLFYQKINFEFMLNENRWLTDSIIRLVDGSYTGNTIIQPKYYNSTWSHLLNEDEKIPITEKAKNYILHIKKIDWIDVTKSKKFNNIFMNSNISEEIDEQIRMFSVNLPRTDQYAQKNWDCYKSRFYIIHNSDIFKNSRNCTRDSLRSFEGDGSCLRADTITKTGPKLGSFNIFYPTFTFLTETSLCF